VPLEKRTEKSLATPEPVMDTAPFVVIRFAMFESNLIAPTLVELVVLPEMLIKPVSDEMLPAKLMKPFHPPVPIAVIVIVPVPEVCKVLAVAPE